MLTARADEVDKIVGHEVGADDYLTKLFLFLPAGCNVINRMLFQPRHLVLQRSQAPLVEWVGPVFLGATSKILTKL